MRAFGLVLAVWVVLGLVQLARAELPSGCVKSSKACDCYSSKGKRVELSRQMCEAAMTPAPVKLAGGDLDAISVKPTQPEPERVPYVKVPISWLIER